MTLIATAICALSARAELAPPEILRAADKARGNQEGIAWHVEVTSVEAGRTNSMSFDVTARGHNFIAEATAPARRKGNKLLFREGNMWFHKPDLSKPAPISERQKLLGKAAYGDIAATDYAEDYDATPLPDQVVNGEDCYVFQLRARSKKTTYDRIVYWISRERLVGVKADYYTVSGKKIKSAAMEHEHRLPLEGGGEQLFCSNISITDEMTPSDTTTLELSAPILEPVPYSAFDLNLLAK